MNRLIQLRSATNFRIGFSNSLMECGRRIRIRRRQAGLPVELRRQSAILRAKLVPTG